jgi:cytochrome c oxidase cbb3-type subunit IV
VSDYNHVREFADSYGLGVMVVFFLLFVLWALRPGSKRHYHDAAVMIFTDDDAETRANGDRTNEENSHG